jgi:L-asparagine transporter-like permease
MLTHIRYRKRNGKPEGNCRLCGFPYSSLFTLLGLIIAMFSMPFIKEQLSGFFAGICLVLFFTICYAVMKFVHIKKFSTKNNFAPKNPSHHEFSAEFSEELHEDIYDHQK